MVPYESPSLTMILGPKSPQISANSNTSAPSPKLTTLFSLWLKFKPAFRKELELLKTS